MIYFIIIFEILHICSPNLGDAARRIEGASNKNKYQPEQIKHPAAEQEYSNPTIIGGCREAYSGEEKFAFRHGRRARKKYVYNNRQWPGIGAALAV